MESAYDRKFEEMKMYIPFLENMIKRLESTSSPSANPRQAQLDKIRSLRDLLQDKKKRMKMENLLKCEQVLVNLYAKVEQKDTLPDIKKPESLFPTGSSGQSTKSDLNIARKKLKSVTKKKQALEQDDPETLPEIARASETEVICVPGSKEPALFQRRPNKTSKSPKNTSSVDKAEKRSPKKTVSMRNYTRVLVSPEPSARRWSTTEDPPSNEPLFSRRSHRRSPRKHSPSHKKDKKKYSKQNKTQDLNITLKVPEESLSSLNTEDILSRIIKCDDNDVDIDKLRDLRTQILRELKQTGASEDISDLILKSYKNKKKRNKKQEIEEGELSDSESEAIQSVYGNLVVSSLVGSLVVDKDKNSGTDINKKTSESEKEPRKIQICLVVNSDKEDNPIGQDKTRPKDTEETDFEMFDVCSKKDSDVHVTRGSSKQQVSSKGTFTKSKTKVDILDNRKVLTIDVEDDEDDQKKSESKNDSKDSDSSCYIDISSSDNESTSNKSDKNTPNEANFYKPINDQETNQKTVCVEAQTNTSNEIPTNTVASETEDKQPSPVKISNADAILDKSSQKEKNQPLNGEEKDGMISATNSNESVPVAVPAVASEKSDVVENTADDMLAEKKSDKIENTTDNIEIPLLNTEAPAKKATVSEIDILQALKNEILSETIAIPGAEVATPPLHQPKVTKVSSAKEVVKKRISIEKYKEKSAPSKKISLFVNEPFSKSRDSVKKTSLKLTEEEQQRFKNILPLALDDSSDEASNIEDIYSDLAPKSPENSDTTSSSATPVIIPSDPVKPTLASSNSDVDMRTLIPILSPNAPKPVPPPNVMPPSILKTVLSESGAQKPLESIRSPVMDPRMRRDLNNPIGSSPNTHSVSLEKTSRAAGHFPNTTLNITPNARSFEMTPSHQYLDFDDGSKNKHVYAPIPAFDPRDNRDHIVNNDHKTRPEPRWEPNAESAPDVRRSRWDSWKDSDLRDRNKTNKYDDRDYRGRQHHDSSQDYHRSRYDSEKYHSEPNRHEQRDDYSHNRTDGPRTPVHPFGRSDCPSTPNPSFGRVDTPTNFYGRKDCPTTPIHAFGRSDCPTTPSHPFGRSDSTTPAHTYGVTDRPMTPSHPFGRSDAPMTPVHPFGRSDIPITHNPFGRSETPMTPSHPFGRSEAPMTPSHPFGRSEAPMTPSHQFGRSEAPLTPSHPFGRSDAPMTPSHPFGRSDAPMTPSHPFGRSDAPMTPNHPFGRSDASMTPSHPFGRTDLGRAPLTPSHPFGRSEHSKNTAPKDPRLNRSNEYDSSSRRYDSENRDRGYYKDRISDGSIRPYNQSSDSYRYHREQSVGRIDKSGDARFRERTPGREPSVGRGMSYDKDRLYSHRGRPNDYRRDFDNSSRNYNELDDRRDYRQRAQSVGRSGPAEDRFQQASSRNDGNKFKSSTVNTLSVKPQTGRSFIIDTSVNTTFQEFLDGKGLQFVENSFEDRRRRAASVGRTLSHIDKKETNTGRDFRESSVGRTLSSRPTNEYTPGYKRMVNFVRARSMGRELTDNKSAKSFKEVKADLISYRDSYKKSTKRNEFHSDPRSRRTDFERKQERKCSPQKNTIYSPRKNYRDPRMYREQNQKSKKYEDTKKTYGIVYSNDNIARGTILGSGYGVKNYKIPKIKRPVEEPKGEPKIEEKKDNNIGKSKPVQESKSKEIKDKKKDITTIVKDDEKKDSKSTVIKNDDASKTKITQGEPFSKSKMSKSKSSDNVSDEKTKEKVKRKSKKAIINSDSDSETVAKTSLDVPKTPADVTGSKPTDSPTWDEKHEESKDASEFESNFGIDDLDVFPEHIASDSVLSSINALIEDLDKEIGSNEDLSQEDAFDKLLENIRDSPGNVDGSSNDLSEVINGSFEHAASLQQNTSETEKLLKQISAIEAVESKTAEVTVESKIAEEAVESKIAQSAEEQKYDNIAYNDKIQTVSEDTTSKTSCSSETNDIDMTSQPLEHKHDIEPNIQTETSAQLSSEPIVSTTEIGEETAVNLEGAEPVIVEKPQEVHEDRSSTPDSTINTSELQKRYGDGLPDSTNEKKNTNADITSTLDQVETLKKDNENHTQKDNSIGNLLSILQDKTKIKELLSMLGDQSGDNEKIKKKLEKLSSIVSDDEEESVDNTNNHDEKMVIGKKENEEHSISEEMPQELAVINSEAPVKSDSIDSTVEAKNDSETQAEIQDEDKPVTKAIKGRKKVLKRTWKGRKKCKKPVPSTAKRLTRAAANLKANKLPRELLRLEESLKEMGSGLTDVLNDTGIRSCRLAKMVDDKQEKESTTQPFEPKPVVVLEKFKNKESDKELKGEEKLELKQRKKPGPKSKSKLPVAEVTESTVTKPKETKIQTGPKYKPGPKSKKNIADDNSDPFSFEDSVSEATTTQMSEQDNDSCSESESMASFGSSEVLADLKKKPKRKRRYKWNSGIISSRKKKKTEHKKTELAESSMEKTLLILQKRTTIPDMNCFTDKTYCFLKNVQSYSCRLCHYTGIEIVKHYKTEHPHAEIPLSRMHAVLAREAIEQCEDINFQTVSKMPTEKYVCRFCYEEFGSKRKDLEEFFWHVVTTHTGEYKQLCSECVNVTRCPFNLDIPPPPKDLQGQLIGYICGKCHFTQISLENLKMHVIVRHNDEQTAVYTINLAVMSKKTMNALMKQHNEKNRTLRSTRSSTSFAEPSDVSDHNELTEHADENIEESVKTTETGVPNLTVQSKLAFEPDHVSDAGVKVEIQEIKDENVERDCSASEQNSEIDQFQPSSDILDYPHFKIYYGDSGAKEYVCCINGKDNHYKTTLIISMKMHVKSKHSEIWDGYCSLCKVIVMPQGQHSFKECLQHMLDTHIDNFPVIDSLETESQNDVSNSNSVCNETVSQTSYINVRPLSDLLTTEVPSGENSVALPKIESVVSLGVPTVAPVTPVVTTEPATTLLKSSAAVDKARPQPEQPYKYEEWQSDVMAKKHPVILDAMFSEEKLVHIYKCAGRYCPFTTDSADLAVLHASTHQRVGGENSLMCAYCDFDSNGNAIDLVMHVFKTHGRCKYVCGQCFYRAVASQLVLAHMHRVHGSPRKILETATATPLGDDTQDILPRDVAVQHYVCSDTENTCKFKTYTQGKFIEHLQKHRAPYLCSICTSPSENPTELLLHLKTHGLKLYQCTWCLSGCDNEEEFLAHTSARHPTREPQAYLRVITSNQKDGVTKTMVLPLVKMNKISAATHLVTATAKVSSDPVREAEKALDLEKIITSTSLFGENKGTSATVQSLPSPQTPCEQPSQLQYTELDTSLMAEVIPISQPIVQTPPPSTPSEKQNTSLMKPVLKTEPEVDTPQMNKLDSNEIICLDSDDDDTSPDPLPTPASADPTTQEKQNIIELNDEELEKTNVRDCKKVDPLMLYKCKRCQMQIKKPQGFKRHIQSCYHGVRDFECAHCSFTVGELDAMFDHYQFDHGNVRRVVKYFCEVCNRSDRSLTVIKAHMRKDHDFSCFKITKTSKDSDHGGIYYTVSDVTKKVVIPKRKLSGGSVTESLPKRIRYGPLDLFKLPQKPILDELTYCSECEFNTKVRLNLVRHIQLHAENQAVPQTAPVNPVPHLETNEKHFDRMVNLASSSLELTRPDKAAPTVTLHIPPDAASRYPKYVPDRQRHTCGAKDCSYISVDEAMLKCHWETLHYGSIDFHCVHCPPYQCLNTTQPLTSARIIAHLKMHDINLYACSSCAYYHNRKQVVEKHVSEVHKGTGQVMIVREESAGLQPGTSSAPTMDLKPWKCGLCEFKSMLRPEVVDHCSKSHNTKMQFKCPACPFRTSTIENVKKHQSNSHSGNTEDVFYYYYREGSIPDEADGTPRWVKQRQKMGIPNAHNQQQQEPEVKTETPDSSCAAQPSMLQSFLLGNTNLSLQNLLNAPAAPPPPSRVNLEIVKKEVPDSESGQSMDDLCRLFGEICDPNGLKYKCPLCKLVMEERKNDFQSHLFEELQYRKWGCSVCSYKAFHKTGLNEHMVVEHRQLRAIEPKELPVDTRVEAWVNRVLDHQSTLIEINKSNLEKHTAQALEKSNPTTSTKVTENPNVPKVDSVKCSESHLENLRQAFGEFGKANGSKFCCPKCEYQTADEGAMKDHLETELNKIRWRCSICSANSQNYHEAQLHSKTCKQAGQQSRPVEAIRDPAIRASWVANVIQTQKEAMEAAPEATDEQMLTRPLENSLLVVRYEERVPTPEEEMINKRKRPAPVAAAASSPDSDDERLVIDDLNTDDYKPAKRKDPNKKCPYCVYCTQYQQALDYHILRHYKLRPITCMNCNATLQNNTATLTLHQKQHHPELPLIFEKTQIPSGPPLVYDLQLKPRNKRSSASSDEQSKSKEDAKKDDGPKLVCLTCEQSMPEFETLTHSHEKQPLFAKKGAVIVKCCVCLMLLPHVNDMQEHYNQSHPNEPINYAYYKVNHNNREIHQCGHCNKRFKFFRDLKVHHDAVHASLQLKYETRSFIPGSNDVENEECGES